MGFVKTLSWTHAARHAIVSVRAIDGACWTASEA
jgi:hypothetical protein